MKDISQNGFTATEFRKPFPSRRSEQCCRLMQFFFKVTEYPEQFFDKNDRIYPPLPLHAVRTIQPFFLHPWSTFWKDFCFAFFLLYNLSETSLCALLTPHTNPILTSQHSLNYSHFSVRELQCNNQSSNHSIHWSLLNLLMKNARGKLEFFVANESLSLSKIIFI